MCATLRIFLAECLRTNKIKIKNNLSKNHASHRILQCFFLVFIVLSNFVYLMIMQRLVDLLVSERVAHETSLEKLNSLMFLWSPQKYFTLFIALLVLKGMSRDTSLL